VYSQSPAALPQVLSGAMKVGQKLTLMPNGLEVQCTEILINDEKTEICQSGDSIKVIDPSQA
jgi:translation elongation factor EF-1alpha